MGSYRVEGQDIPDEEYLDKFFKVLFRVTAAIKDGEFEKDSSVISKHLGVEPDVFIDQLMLTITHLVMKEKLILKSDKHIEFLEI